jgi:hypothetical protein
MQASKFIKTAAQTSERFINEVTVKVITRMAPTSVTRRPLITERRSDTLILRPTQSSTEGQVDENPFTTEWMTQKFNLDANAIREVTKSGIDYLFHFNPGYGNEVIRIEKALETKGIICFRKGDLLKIPTINAAQFVNSNATARRFFRQN